MSLMQVLTTRDSFQSTTTPYAFLGGSSTFHESRDAAAAASDITLGYFSTSGRPSDHLPHHPRDHEVYLGSTAAAPGAVAATQDLKLSSSSNSGSNNTKCEKPSWDERNSHHQQAMNSNLQHVAQQSRREKLRIPGSLQQPTSPPSDGVRSQQGGGGGGGSTVSDIHHHHHHDGYAGNPSQDAMLSVYNNPMLAPELYNYTSGSELLNAVSGKSQGYILTGANDGMVYNPGLHSNVLGKGGGAWSGGGGGGSSGQFPTAMPNVNMAMPQTGAFGSTTGRDLGSYFAGGGGTPNAQEAMQLYLMNAAAAAAAAGYGGFNSGDGSPASAPASMVFVPGPPSASTQQSSQLIGIPLHGSQNSLSQTSQVTSVSNSPVGYQSGGRGAGGNGGGGQYASWKSSGDELMFMPGSDRAKSFGNGQEVVSDFSEYQQTAAAFVHESQAAAAPGGHGAFQGLSLSLSSQQPQPLNAFDVMQQSGLDSGQEGGGLSQDGKRSKLAADLSHFRRDFGGGGGAGKVHLQQQLDSGVAPAMSASFNVISSSRYLKACQQLLEEVCSVGRGAKQNRPRAASNSQGWTAAGGASPLMSPTSGATTATTTTATANPAPSSKDAAASVAAATATAAPAPASSSQEVSIEKDAAAAAATSSPSGAAPAVAANNAATTSGTGTASAAAAPSSTEAGAETTSALSAEEKQELETKKSKLVGMLQEVDRRYRQYYDQMQVVISSFDAVAGVGAATPYTALALQAMSRYFRCLKDAITGQISLVCNSLGEEDISKQITTKSPTSRLRFIDQQIRQQRAFQQLGMLNQHAWRPQRGLPERSVSILRAWLFEHFLHPYPKDADKMMLAKQTGLTRSQVSNWFINARVRLWKPMVEEMYQEETREHDLDAAVARMHAENDESELKSGSEALSDPKSKMVVMDQPGQQQQQQDFIHDTDFLRKQQQQQQQSLLVGSVAADMYDDSGVQQQLKKSRYHHDASSDLLISSHHMDVDLKPESGDDSLQQHGYGGGGGGGYHDQRFAANHPGVFRYNVNASQGSHGVSLTLGLQHSDSSLGGVVHPHAAAAYLQPQAFHGLQQSARRSDHGGGGAGDDFSSLYENAAAAAAAGLHDGINYASRKHMESQLLHDFVPS